jgi:hypothetical protein
MAAFDLAGDIARKLLGNGRSGGMAARILDELIFADAIEWQIHGLAFRVLSFASFPLG